MVSSEHLERISASTFAFSLDSYFDYITQCVFLSTLTFKALRLIKLQKGGCCQTEQYNNLYNKSKYQKESVDMKIYFAGSIRGGRQDAQLYQQIISHLKLYGEVLTEHIGNTAITNAGENLPTPVIHDRDLNWLLSSEVIVAEVTTPSLGVGYEIGRAIEHKKNTLCLYRPQEGRSLSSMISGCKTITTVEYTAIEDLNSKIDAYFKELHLRT